MERKDITAISLKLLQEWDNRGFSPYSINCGYCDIFAEQVVEELREGEIEETAFHANNPQHVWVYYQGKYYDSEVPFGVDDWRELPIFLRNGV